MPKAEIVITQGGASGTPGVARRDLDLFAVGGLITFSNSTTGDQGVVSWEWTLIEAPPGSTATLVGGTSSTCTLSTDVYGRYVVSLRVNGMGGLTPGYSMTVAGCPYPTLGTLPSGDEFGDWALPSFYERTYANWLDVFSANNPYGAQPELWRILDQIRNYVVPAAFPSNSYVIPIQLSPALVSRTDQPSPAWQASGYSRLLNMASFPWITHAYFCSVLLRDGTAGTAQARLYDYTHSVAVTGAAVTTAAGPVHLTSAALVVGGGAGNLRNDVNTMYRVDIEITGGVLAADFVSVMDAFILLMVL